MLRLVLLSLTALLVAGCAQVQPVETDPDPDPLTVSIADYYATNGTKTLVLENIIASRPETLYVIATCYLYTGPSLSLTMYAGTIAVETQGSNRSLQISGTVASPGATSIDCQSIEGEAPNREKVSIRVR